MLTEALFYNSPNWKYPKCTSPVEWLNFDIDMQQSITQQKKKKKGTTATCISLSKGKQKINIHEFIYI